MSASVVVGASGAIGRVLVGRLVAAGQPVVAVARDRQRLEALAGPGVTLCPADVTGAEAGPAVLHALDGAPVDLLAYSASAPLGGHILATDDEVMRAALEVKVLGLLRLVRALEGQFATPARVVAIGGSLGLDPSPDASTAGIANAAQANAVRQLNRALAPRGVTCHTVAPGPVLTERFRTLAGHAAERRGLSSDEIIAEATAATPTGRLTTPEEVAWAVITLTAPEATALAGATLLLDGGQRTALP